MKYRIKRKWNGLLWEYSAERKVKWYTFWTPLKGYSCYSDKHKKMCVEFVEWGCSYRRRLSAESLEHMEALLQMAIWSIAKDKKRKMNSRRKSKGDGVVKVMPPW